MSRRVKYILYPLITGFLFAGIFLIVAYSIDLWKFLPIVLSIVFGLIIGILTTLFLHYTYKRYTKVSKESLATLSRLETEKARVGFILNNMSQGIVVLKENKEISIINSKVSDLFGHPYKYFLNKPYTEIFKDAQLQAIIERAIRGEKVPPYEFETSSLTFRLVFNSLTSAKSVYDAKDLKLAIIFTDISDLTEASILKQKFIANASHELKTPLTTIIGYQQLISCGLIQDPSEMKDYGQLTLKEAMRMNEIVKDMLELSRIEGNLDSKISSVDLKKVVLDQIEALELKITNKELKVITDLSDCTLDINESHAYSLVTNLIENAVKYSLNKGTITVVLDSTHLSVSDDGIGIAESDLNRVFNRFFRSHAVLTEEGSGLGLAIVKHICELYGYKVSVTSKLGEGSTFNVDFTHLVHNTTSNK